MSEQERQEAGHDEERKGAAGGWSREDLSELYETMSRMFRDKLERAGTLTEDAFERAMQETRDWATRMRESYREDVSRVSDFIRRDWYEGIRYARDQYRRNFDLDRLQAGAMGALSRLAKSAGEQLEAFASKLSERLTYKTGEIAGAGSLECTGCGQVLSFEKARRIPPCPKCHGTSFRRSF